MMIVLTMMLILLFMGAFMDWVGIVLLIIPVFLPIVLHLPIEEIGFVGQLEPKNVAIWFGVLFCMNMQVSFLSPPFGPAAFYLKSVAPPHIALTDIFKGFFAIHCDPNFGAFGVGDLAVNRGNLAVTFFGGRVMLTQAQIESFQAQGYFVVDDVLDQASVLEPVRAENAAQLDQLIVGWQASVI
jgi:hypothetical protein